MSEHATYDIRTVRDLLAVPAERREDCLSELRTWLAIHDHVDTLIGVPGAWDGVFQWVDDGRRDMKIQITVRPEVPSE